MSPAPRPVVALVDDDAAVRNAVRLLLKAEGITVTGFATAQEFLAEAGEKPYACVLLDLQLPGMSGTDLLDVLTDRRIPVPIILLTGHATVAAAVNAMRAGVVDVIEKPFDDDRLIAAVRQALELGERWRQLLEDRQRAQERVAVLTPRELDVLDLMVQGKPNLQIAEELGISPKTLDIHRTNLMRKMHARSVADMVRLRILDRTDPLGLTYLKT
jgi:two-component system, LuxR family, response regulator FixJ